MKHLRSIDPKIYNAIKNEIKRQEDNLELIASENFTSLAVLEAQGSVLTNKYAEGYPRHRWYGGCEFVDEAEQLAIERAKKLFRAEHVNVQAHSGTQANMAVYFAALNLGDTVLAMDLAAGGHLTHGHPHNFSGMFFSSKPDPAIKIASAHSLIKLMFSRTDSLIFLLILLRTEAFLEAFFPTVKAKRLISRPLLVFFKNKKFSLKPFPSLNVFLKSSRFFNRINRFLIFNKQELKRQSFPTLPNPSS